jgi:hypothetical protein
MVCLTASQCPAPVFYVALRKNAKEMLAERRAHDASARLHQARLAITNDLRGHLNRRKIVR